MYVQKYGQYSQYSPAGHFADFGPNFRILEELAGDEFKSWGPHLLDSNHVYT